MKGKQTCAVLKAVRRRVADDNHVAFQPHDCTFQGDCKGTCPACEAEVRYLENELEKRRRAGKTVVLAGVAASVLLTACGSEAPATPVSAPTATVTSTTATSTTHPLTPHVSVGELPEFDGDIVVPDIDGVIVPHETDGLLPLESDGEAQP